MPDKLRGFDDLQADIEFRRATGLDRGERAPESPDTGPLLGLGDGAACLVCGTGFRSGARLSMVVGPYAGTLNAGVGAGLWARLAHAECAAEAAE